MRILLRGLFALVLAAALAYWALSLWHQLYQPAKARHRIAALRNAELREEVRSLQRTAEALARHRNALEAAEPTAVEEAIRAEMGWGRPGECLVQLPREADPDSEDTDQ